MRSVKQKKKKGRSYMIGGVPCVIFNEPGPNMLKSIRKNQNGHSESKDSAQHRMAEAYARWLAARDGVKLPADCAGQIEWDYDYSARKVRKRVKAVIFARYRDSGGGYYTRGRREWFEPVATIAIPNWDFDQPEPVDLSYAPAMQVAA